MVRSTSRGFALAIAPQARMNFAQAGKPNEPFRTLPNRFPVRAHRPYQWRAACAVSDAFFGITLAEAPCGAYVQAPCGAPRRRAQLLLPLRLRTVPTLDASHSHRAQTFRSATPRNLNPSNALCVAWQSGPVGTLPRPPRCSRTRLVLCR